MNFHKILITNFLENKEAVEITADYKMYFLQISKNYSAEVKIFDDYLSCDNYIFVSVFEKGVLKKTFELEINDDFHQFANWLLPISVKNTVHPKIWIDNSLLGKEFSDSLPKSIFGGFDC